MRVATEETPGETATVGVWIDAGSVHENEKENGVAHFLEHMAFKGTNKRGREALEKEIENMGGQLNAYTSREQTVYFAKVFKNDAPRAIEILSDILQNSTYSKEAVESEKGVILRELEEVNKNYHELVMDYLHGAAFQGTSLGRTILGPVENIKSITRDDLVKYVQKYYRGPRMVLSAAGAVKHEEIAAAAQKNFTQLGSEAIVEARPKASFIGSAALQRDDTMHEAHIALAVESVGWTSPDYYTFLLIQTLIGAWDRNIGGGRNISSKLGELIATEHLAHSMSAFNTCFADTGIFGVYTVAGPDTLEDLVCEVFKEFVRISRNVTPSEIERAKAKLKAAVLMQLDGTTPVAEDIGRQMLVYGRRLTPAEIFLRIDSITTADVMRVARRHFEDVSPAVAAVGPLYLFPDYNNIRDWTYWRRY